MVKEVSNTLPTLELLNLARNGERDIKYESTQAILQKWRKGVDLEFLAALITSESSSDRLRGAFYLTELGQGVEELDSVSIRLADDPLSDCRKAFVEYSTNSERYNAEMRDAMAKRLLDLDLYVRVAAINWAVRLTDTDFHEFSQVVEVDAGHPEIKFRRSVSNDFWNKAVHKRAVRALEIARFVRDGMDIAEIKERVPGEDSFVLDSLEFSKTRRERLR